MTFANAQISDIIATSIDSRSKVLRDNVMNKNGLLFKLKERGNVRPISGGATIFEEIMYNDPSTITAGSYSGYEAINVNVNSPISAAQFAVKQYAASVTLSGLEMLQNSGKEQMVDLLEGRMRVAEAQLMNSIAQDIYNDGTGNGGRAIDGLAAAIPTGASPVSTGVYGGIDRASWAFWRPSTFRATTTGGAATNAANIQEYLTRLTVSLQRQDDFVDLIVMDNTYYGFYVSSLQAIQRITNDTGSGLAGAGFATLKFYGAGSACDVVLDGGIGSNMAGATVSRASSAYAINTKYLHYRPHRDRNFVAIGGERQSVNQDAIVKLIGWAGNLTCSGDRYHGLLYEA